jgi:hypothetical protein
MNDEDDFSNSCDDDDSEGSLVDFIVDDDEEEEEEEDDMGEDNASYDGDEDGDEVEDVAEITQQYNPSLESHGIVLNSEGLRRSSRLTKGKPPVKYVDEDYLQLMTEDIGSDLDKMSSESDEEEELDDEEDGEFEIEEGEDAEED